jgi:hypothetical protein
MCVLSYERKLTRTQLLSLGSYQVTEVGFTVMVQKQSNDCHTGRVHNHQEQERHGMSGVQQRACSLLFFYVKGIVRNEFVPPNTTVSYDFYCDVLRHLRENVQWKNCNFGTITTGFFIMTCPPIHSLTPQSLWLTHGHHFSYLYSPDLASCDFALFPKLKLKLKGQRFESVWHSKGIASDTTER